MAQLFLTDIQEIGLVKRKGFLKGRYYISSYETGPKLYFLGAEYQPKHPAAIEEILGVVVMLHSVRGFGVEAFPGEHQLSMQTF